MFTKIALTAAVIFGTASAALATEFDSNLANRYPAYASTESTMLEGRNVALTGGQSVIIGSQAGLDRASNASAGGGF